jgi:bacterioferritin-associated ferredoxin
MEDIIICRCEDVTEKEILKAIRGGLCTLEEIKRFLRCTMGYCQGRNCTRLIVGLICKEKNISPEEVELPRLRPPLKPIELEILAGK